MIAAGIVLLTVGGVDLTRRSLTGMRRAIVLAVLGLVVLIASVLVAMECASALKRLRHEVRGEAP